MINDASHVIEVHVECKLCQSNFEIGLGYLGQWRDHAIHLGGKVPAVINDLSSLTFSLWRIG
jgi:hypothetical protein